MRTDQGRPAPQALPGPAAISSALTGPRTLLCPVAVTKAPATGEVTGWRGHRHSIPPPCVPPAPGATQTPYSADRGPHRPRGHRGAGPAVGHDVLGPRRDRPPPTCQNQGPAKLSGSSGRPSGDICRQEATHRWVSSTGRSRTARGQRAGPPPAPHRPGGRGAGPLLPGPRQGQRRRTRLCVLPRSDSMTACGEGAGLSTAVPVGFAQCPEAGVSSPTRLPAAPPVSCTLILRAA